MARKYVNPNRLPADWPTLEQAAAALKAGRPLDLHSFAREAARRERVAELDGKEAPGARLDGWPFAASWGRFLAEVRSGGEAIRNAMGEEKPSDGGFLVPESLRSEVYAYLERNVVRPRAMVVPMDTLRVGTPALDNLTQSSNAGALGGMTFSFVREGVSIPASTPGLARVVLEARKLAGFLTDVPNELVEDGGAAWEAWIGPVVGRGYAFWEDWLLLNGSGVGEPEGLLAAPCAVKVTRSAAGKVKLADVLSMRARVAPASLEAGSAVWLASPATVAQLGQLSIDAAGVDGSSNATEVPVPPTSGMGLSVDRRGHWRLAGLRLIETSKVPDLGTEGDLCVADFSCYALGDRREFTVERAKAGPGYIADTSDFRMTARLDGRWLIRNPITPANGGATVSPVVILS